MTFLCKDCAEILNVPNVEIRTFRSYGSCERCDKVGGCLDIHHSHISIKQNQPSVKESFK